MGYLPNSVDKKLQTSSADYPSNPKEWGDEYLLAMKRAHQQSNRRSVPLEMKPPRERRRQGKTNKIGITEDQKASTLTQSNRISIIASMVPDEIIYKSSDYDVRTYDAALMFIDISGFTELCERYTKPGLGGPSRLTQVLNSYIGAMVQEIMAHNGDVLKFSGDAFLSMWKKSPRLSMQEVVHTAIDCGLIIQKNYGIFKTDVGVKLNVKVAISAGLAHFSIIGGGTESSQSHYVIVGQPVWDVKMAQYMSTAGDVLTSASAWIYVNEAEYCTQPCGDGRHTKVLGVGATWKRVENGHNSMATNLAFFSELMSENPGSGVMDSAVIGEISYREFSLRPAIVSALRSNWWPDLRRFMVTPVLRAVDNDEPMDFLTEVRRVVVVFLNIITRTVTEDVLIGVVDKAYKLVCSLTSAAGGLVNKVSMFDKDMMFLVVFGLRGLKHEHEAQKALLCAHQLKAKLDSGDSNILSVSIAVTSGTSYCGVVGHVLRREYTVIGPAVNKAARLMMVYPTRVTCDKETFLRSKLEQDNFKLMEPKHIKGIASVGPIYEFKKLARTERIRDWRHPLLGRNEELRKYKLMLHNAINESSEKFTKFKNHKFGIAFIGPKLVGKARLVDECHRITPTYMQIEKIQLTDKEESYEVFRKIMKKSLPVTDQNSSRQSCENMIRYCMDTTELKPLQLHALNVIFDLRFPLPEKFEHHGDILSDFGVKTLLRDLIKSNFTRLWVFTIYEGQFIDDESWRLILLILETKTTFFIFTLSEDSKLTNVGQASLKNHMIVSIHLVGIDRWYHAALACQLLDVQAIPPDLEKVIECASGGFPGWIQNFVISLVQRGVLSIVTVTRNEAVDAGAVIPAQTLLQRCDDDEDFVAESPLRGSSYQSIYSIVSTKSRTDISRYNECHSETDVIQMAVLSEGYSFDDMKTDMTMDVVILKTYDSLTPFEKMVLKCGSVLGEVFSRRMLLYLLQIDTQRIVAQAVAKLFSIHVLECEGGDFTRDTSNVLIHPAPALSGVKSPHCACLGTRHPPDCRDLPLYAFCGYMRFRHSLFRTTTYELLTENQKHEMHSRALMYLERYTRRCNACGSGCFVKLLGLRCDDESYEVFRKIMKKSLPVTDQNSSRQSCENMIRYCMDTTELKPLQLHALNVIFDLRFPLPEKFEHHGDILSDFGVKTLLRDLIKSNFTRLWVFTIYEGQFIDDESWRLILLILETKTTFFIFTLSEDSKLTNVGQASLKNHMIVSIHLVGIDRWYHAALACQLLDVQAIPPDLEKVIECASGGFPGWIQNFVISLVQRGVLSIVTVTRNEAVDAGAVIPAQTLLQRCDDDEDFVAESPLRGSSYQSIYSIVSTKSRTDISRYNECHSETDVIQMAVLSEGYSFDDMKTDMTMDVVILKTYDSLTPFEKMVLKCGSVLGEVFSRRMLLYLLQIDTQRIVAQAVAKLFSIHVLECEGGDFTRDTSNVLIHPAPALSGVKSPHCACLGTRHPPDCRDLPLYAFCGYMRFRHSLFRTTTYELLTENQKHEMHSRALMYLERYTRRCNACGSGCFVKLLGLRCDDGLRYESEDLKRTRQQIRNLTAETRITGEYDYSTMTAGPSRFSLHSITKRASPGETGSEGTIEITERRGSKTFTDSIGMYNNKQVRSFSSLELGSCECLAILLSVYCQIIEHCKGADEHVKLYEAYMEYADMSILKLNIPQAIRLLFELETFVKTHLKDERPHWLYDFRLANIHSLRGVCMLESGDLGEAREQLFTAMKLYYKPFPTSNLRAKFSHMKVAFHQLMAMSIAPQCYVARESGYVGYYYEDIALTLNRMYRLFLETKEEDNATLAAKWSFNYALRTNSNFRILCTSYGNMIAVYRQKQKFSMCRTLEKRVMEVCHRKRGQLDVTEVQSVCYLYTTLFLFFVEYGKKMESIQFGLSVMRMMSGLTDLSTRQMLILWMLKFLLSDLRIYDMVAIMREFFYMIDHYDLSSETWYYYYAIVILLDTGYCVESYTTCEKFYIKKGDAILRSKSPEAAWNFFVCMWLVTIRVGAWERSIIWEEKIKKIPGTQKFERHEFGTMIVVRLLEGLLITLVSEMNNRNIKKITVLEKSIDTMLKDLKSACNRAPMFTPRYYLLLAYFDYIRGKKLRAFSYINKSIELARQYAYLPMQFWAEHTRDHWKGTLKSKYENYWIEHMDSENLLDYRDFDSDKGKIVPYTLPLPRDMEG